MEVKKENPHKGHREKVKARYLVNGLNGMPQHNVLELLLFFGIPYKDTNEIAHKLIEHFGSFSGVLEAKPNELVKIKGMTENAAILINMILPLYKQYAIDLNAHSPCCDSSEKLAEYIRNLLLDTNDERVFAICFDYKRRLIGCKIIGEGDIISSTVDYRRLAEVLLETKANSIIIAHNHPHGITSPSKDDIEATKEIFRFVSTLKVRLLDHIIVNDTSYLSMAETLHYAYIFSGMTNSPFERDYDSEIETAKKELEEKRLRENRERCQRLLREAEEREKKKKK
ncbi:MAG: hypothetical protein IKJ27_06505 [Clostridia bacterium]|nr:hypothetical protein [Clostridia bacterium]